MNPLRQRASGERRHAVESALGAIALWSALAAVAQKLQGMPPFLLVGIALVLGGAVGLPAGVHAGLRPRSILLGVYGFFLYHFCLFLGLRLAPAVRANLVNYLWPLLIVVLSPMIVPGTRLQARHVAGALLGFAGTVLLVFGGSSGIGSSKGDMAALGYLLALMAAVIWSTYSLLTTRLGSVPTGSISISCLVSGVLSLACHAALEPRHVPSVAEWPWLFVLGVGPMGAAFYLWSRAMKKGDPRVIGTLAYLTPLMSTFLIAITGGGRVDGMTALAGALIVGGGAVGARSRVAPAA